MKGRYLGDHEGIAFYTPGQRRGLGIAAGRRLYVQQVHPLTNTVVLGTEESLRRNQCDVADLNLFDSSLLMDQQRSRSRSDMPHLLLLQPSNLVQMALLRIVFQVSHNAH